LFFSACGQASRDLNSNKRLDVEHESGGLRCDNLCQGNPWSGAKLILSFVRHFELPTRGPIDQYVAYKINKAGEEHHSMCSRILPRAAALVLGAALMAPPAFAEGLKDEIAPTGKLRVAIGISAAGGAFWSKADSGGYSGVPVDLGKEMAAQLGVPVEYVAFPNSGKITDAASTGTWDVTFLPQDPERETKMSFGPIYEVADATYIIKAGSPIKDFATLDQPGIKVAAVNNTTTMRGAQAHLKNAKVTGYQTYDEIIGLLKNGEVDAFALSRDQLNELAQKIPGTKVLDQTFKKTVTAVAVPLNHPQSLAFVKKFMADAIGNGTMRKAYDNNGLAGKPIRTE
jgi:polar amino acid transport system substrate-binding protein